MCTVSVIADYVSRCLVVPWLVAHLVQLVCLGWLLTLASLGLTLHLLLQVMALELETKVKRRFAKVSIVSYS